MFDLDPAELRRRATNYKNAAADYRAVAERFPGSDLAQRMTDAAEREEFYAESCERSAETVELIIARNVSKAAQAA